MSRRYLNTYLDEFLWRRINTTDRYDASERILDAIADQYPLDDVDPTQTLFLESFLDLNLDNDIIDCEGNIDIP